MKRLTGLLALALALTVPGCVSSSLVLHVAADGRGHAVITSRVFESGIRAFQSLISERSPDAPTLEQPMPAPSEGELQHEFGARVRLVSTKLDKATDGGIRTTIVDFDDVTQLQLRFPPLFTSLVTGLTTMGADAQPLITFATKPHENGDRLLIVKMPDQRLSSEPDEPITSSKTDSAEDVLLFKRAFKGSALRFFVELEQPLLRTNAPAHKGNRSAE